MKSRQCFGLAVVVSGILVACTTGSSSTGAPADATGFIAQLCELYSPCCAKVSKPTDGAACRAFYGAFAAPAQYDAAKGGDCLAEIRAEQTKPEFCDGASAGAPSCRSVFKQGGAKSPGEDCTKDSDCASSPEGDVSCASSYGNGAETKACQVEVDGTEGDAPCVATRDGNTTFGSSTTTAGDAGPPRPPAKGYVCDLAKGLFCDSKSRACAKVQDVGGDCDTSSSHACVKSAFCDFSTKKCAARLPVGADCSKSSTSCLEKANCDRTTKKCVAGLPDGAPCTTGSECESDRCVNTKCQPSGSGSVTTQLLCGG